MCIRDRIDIKVLFVDYAGKLASIARDKEDFDRISNCLLYTSYRLAFGKFDFLFLKLKFIKLSIVQKAY